MAETEDPIAGALFLKGLADQGSQRASPTTRRKPHRHLCSYLSRSATFVLLAALLAYFPAQAPEFLSQTVITRIWELLHLLLVGLAVSYGLFSRRSAFDPAAAAAAAEHPDGSRADTAPAFVSDLLQVPRVFDDDDANKLQTWSHQCYRAEPVVFLVAEEGSGGAGGPLRLPVRSLRSPVDNGGDVHPPIPRKPRSEKMAAREEASPPSFSLPTPAMGSDVSTSRPPPFLPAAPSPDLREKRTCEDSGKRKTVYKPPPPPPPPPPPRPRLLNLGSHGPRIAVEGYSPGKPIRRTARPKEEAAAAAQGPALPGWSPEPPQPDVLAFPGPAPEESQNGEKIAHEEANAVGDKFVVVTDDDDSDSDDDSVGSERGGDPPAAEADEVDKKADEFIAKFREQIRLQRIESIRRSAGQRGRRNPPASRASAT